MTGVFAPAKINLCLHVTGRRENGYHILDSLMTFTDFGDRISVETSDTPRLSVSGAQGGSLTGDLLSAGRGSPNLVIRALYALSDATGHAPNIHIRLEKNIPAGAGLGGGSSDAAATLKALNALWGAPLSTDELCALALPLGAELPVCIRQQAARVRGIGENITHLMQIPSFPLLIVWPGRPLLTADIFREFRKNQAFDEPLSPCPETGDWNTWLDYLAGTGNSLTETAVVLCPEIAEILDNLDRQEGCRLARMTGSGSACFGVFTSPEQARYAAGGFRKSHTVIPGFSSA